LPVSEATQAQLAEMMVGELRAPDRGPAARPVERGRPRLEVSELWVESDRGGFAVKGVSFTVGAGEVLGVAGVEGNGQVELTEALAGVRRASRGTILVDGRALGRTGTRRLRRLGITHVPADRQRTGLVAAMSIGGNLVLPVAGRRPYSRLGVLRPREIDRSGRELMEQFDIRAPSTKVQAGALSGGNQQKLILARELSRRPAVIVACYPTRGLDFGATTAVQHELVSHRDEGAAIVYVSVDLDELIGLTDRIIVLHRGEVQGELPAASATPEQLGLLMGGAEAA
jgi:simple sugar transport system ATP-binding protein